MLKYEKIDVSKEFTLTKPMISISVLAIITGTF